MYIRGYNCEIKSNLAENDKLVPLIVRDYLKVGPNKN